MTLSFQYAYGHSCQKLRTRTQMRASPCGSYIRKKMTARPKTMSRAEAMSPNPCGYTLVRDVAVSFRTSGSRVMKTAPRIDPRMLPIPPVMTLAREAMATSSGDAPGDRVREWGGVSPPARPAENDL